MCVPRATRACPIAEGIEYTCTPSPFQLARLMDFLFTVQMNESQIGLLNVNFEF